MSPAKHDPAPGLAMIPFRVGTYGAFRAAMIAGIARHPPLAGLKTREASDPAIALLDAWSTTLDVLTFYQERIVNEGYLRPSVERRSVLELARATGYELAPGVAAGSFLALVCDEVPGSPEVVPVPAGTKVQSVPAPERAPQLFETSEDIEARPAFNALAAEATQYRLPQNGDTVLYLDEAGAAIGTGDSLLILGDERRRNDSSGRWLCRKVMDSEFIPADPATGRPGYTIVTLDEPLGPANSIPAEGPTVYRLERRTNLFGFNAADWKTLPLSLRVGELDPRYVLTDQADAVSVLMGGGKGRVRADSGADFGKESTRRESDPFLAGPYGDRERSWADALFAADESFIYLDQVYDDFVKGSWIVLRRAGPNGSISEVYEVLGVTEVTKTDYGLSNKVTRLKIQGQHVERFSPRNATVFGVSSKLEWGLAPVTDHVAGASVVLSQPVDGLAAGRLAAVTGIDATNGDAFAQVMTVLRTERVTGKSLAPTTKVHFTNALGAGLKPESVRLNANLVPATHGESREMVIGSGDAARAFQVMTLPDAPLTYVSANSPSGRATTLQVRVDGVRWSEVASFKDRGPTERIYTTRIADEGTVSVRFGDGKTGARLPTGQNNVIASYRVGIGLDGHVPADAISQLMTRPLGLKSATNPRGSTGAEDPESIDGAKRNAPQSLRAMDRIVSLTDYADFALAFGGIGKARAAPLWVNGEELVHLTIAGADGAVLGAADDTFVNLAAAIDAARHPDRPVHMAGYGRASFGLEARITVDPAYLVDDVLAAVRAAVLDGFSFDRRGFAEAVTASAVIVAMQRVAGVVAVDLEALYRTGETAALNAVVPARPERVESGTIQPAELLTVDPGDITLLEAGP